MLGAAAKIYRKTEMGRFAWIAVCRRRRLHKKSASPMLGATHKRVIWGLVFMGLTIGLHIFCYFVEPFTELVAEIIPAVFHVFADAFHVGLEVIALVGEFFAALL